MKIEDYSNKIEVISGCALKDLIITNAKSVFDKEIVNFLSTLSKNLLHRTSTNIELRNFSGFLFWIRKANLSKMKSQFSDLENRYGRGLSLHITPSHIAVNALYSFVFSILSGSPCLIRISKANLKELNPIFSEINHLISKKEFRNLGKYFSFITYEHSDEINQFLSSIVNSRLIWGGDSTIKLFKKYSTKTSCIDIPFPNRVSSALINFNQFICLSKEDRSKLAKGFAKDISIFNQLACSSPFYIFYIKGKKLDIKENLLIDFFDKVNLEIKELRGIDTSEVEHFKSSADLSIFSPKGSIPFYISDHLTILKIKNQDLEKLQNYKPSNSCLVLLELKNFNEVSKYIHKSNQTIVCIPFNKEIGTKLIKEIGCTETSRIVTAGNALNMHHFWEGYNVIGMLSKNIKFF